MTSSTTLPERAGRSIRPVQPAMPRLSVVSPRGRKTLVAALLGMLLLATNLRAAITTISPLLGELGDLRLTPALAGLLGSLGPLAFAAAGVIGGALLRRTSAERIAVGALLVTAAGQLIRPWAGLVPWSFMLISAVTLVGMGIGNVILPALVKAWFPHRIGLVTAAYVTMVAVGTSVPALLAVPLIRATGDWHLTLAVWGLVALLPVPLWAALARRPRAVPAPAESRTAKLRMHRSRVAWGMALLFGTNSLNIYAMIVWLPSRLIDAGAGAAHAGTMLALFTGIGVIPSLLVPPLATRLRPEILIGVVLACFAAGHAGLLWAPDTATWAWVILAGLGGGGFPLALTLIGLRSETPAAAGALSGFGQGFGYLAAAAGPLLFGALHEATGGYGASFGFLFVSLGLMALAAWLLRGDRTVEQDLAERALRAG